MSLLETWCSWPPAYQGQGSWKGSMFRCESEGCEASFLTHLFPNYALTPEPHLEDQGVQGSVNTLEEVAASSNNAEYVGEREEEERERRKDIYL